MVALHPPLSGMPLAFIVLLACVEGARCFTSWRDRLAITQGVLVIATGVASVAAFLSGYQASGELGDLGPGVQAALGEHHALGRLLLINSILMVSFYGIAKIALYGKRIVCLLYSLAVCIQLVLSAWVGYLGGSLVFDRGLGVQKLDTNAQS